MPDRAQGDYVCEVRRREAARCAGQKIAQPPNRAAFIFPFILQNFPKDYCNFPRDVIE